MTLLDRYQQGDERALARLLSLIEDRDPAAAPALAAIRALPPSARTIGLTGPPGAGKSTLAGALVGWWRAQGQRVAVLAVDPSSPRTGGATLGDRVRLSQHFTDSGVYIRSMAARGWPGGLAEATEAAMAVLAAFGFDVVLVETVGVGQSDIDIARLVDVVVLAQAPGQGDEVQALKAGLLEIADVIAVTKGDLPSAQQFAAHLRALVAPVGRTPPPVMITAATTGAGISELAARIADLPSSRVVLTLTATAARTLVLDLAVADVRRRLDHSSVLTTLADDVARGTMAPAAAARVLLRDALPDG